jgi:dihydropteroate synthase
MGILNINDDSFCDDGRLEVDWALNRSRELVAQGADIIDVGAESGRTNRSAIPVEQELSRLLPFLERFPYFCDRLEARDAHQVFPPLVSVNTWRPEIAASTLGCGVHMLNDLSALPDDGNARICAEEGAALVIMHSIGLPKVAHTHIVYEDVIADLLDFFRRKIYLAGQAGLSRNRIVLDPGIDFAKQAPDNLRILRELELFREFERPILLPVSRKSVIRHVLGISSPGERDAATAACIVAGMLRGASIFRVHNVEMAWRVAVSIQRLVAE